MGCTFYHQRDSAAITAPALYARELLNVHEYNDVCGNNTQFNKPYAPITLYNIYNFI